MQEFCESDHARGNASHFGGGLDFGLSTLSAAVAKAFVANAVWWVRKSPLVMVSGVVKEFCQTLTVCASSWSDLARFSGTDFGPTSKVTRTSVCREKIQLNDTDFGPTSKTFKSDHSFWNRLSALSAAVAKAFVVNAVWRVRKSPPVMVSGVVHEFC